MFIFSPRLNTASALAMRSTPSSRRRSARMSQTRTSWPESQFPRRPYQRELDFSFPHLAVLFLHCSSALHADIGRFDALSHGRKSCTHPRQPSSRTGALPAACGSNLPPFLFRFSLSLSLHRVAIMKKNIPSVRAQHRWKLAFMQLKVRLGASCFQTRPYVTKAGRSPPTARRRRSGRCQAPSASAPLNPPP